MRLGNSCRLLTIGAVLAFAVHVDLEAVDVARVGWILMLAAVAGALVELAAVRPRAATPAAAARTGTGRPTPVPAAVVRRQVRPAQGTGDRRGSLAPWSAWETRAFTPVPRPDRES